MGLVNDDDADAAADTDAVQNVNIVSDRAGTDRDAVKINTKRWMSLCRHDSPGTG